MPDAVEEWTAVADGYEKIRGYPDVAGAIDGALIEVERPQYHEGYDIFGDYRLESKVTN
jgi:hypothetical protein